MQTNIKLSGSRIEIVIAKLTSDVYQELNWKYSLWFVCLNNRESFPADKIKIYYLEFYCRTSACTDPHDFEIHGTGSEIHLPKDMASEFQLQILSTDQLLQQPSVLNATVSLVNTAYLDHKAFNGTLRFNINTDLCDQLESGLCAVFLDGDGYAVATASVTPWTKQEKETIEKLNGFVYEVHK